jgi:hypothetical protein
MHCRATQGPAHHTYVSMYVHTSAQAVQNLYRVQQAQAISWTALGLLAFIFRPRTVRRQLISRMEGGSTSITSRMACLKLQWNKSSEYQEPASGPDWLHGLNHSTRLIQETASSSISLVATDNLRPDHSSGEIIP